MVARRWCTQNPRWGHAGQLERKAPVGCGFAAALTETRAFPCSAPKCIFGELSSCLKRCGQFEAVRFLGPEWHSLSTATSRDVDIQWPNWTGSILVAATIIVKVFEFGQGLKSEDCSWTIAVIGSRWEEERPWMLHCQRWAASINKRIHQYCLLFCSILIN